MVVVYPLACNSLASEAETIPFPREEVTPPVTKMYFVLDIDLLLLTDYKNTKKKQAKENKKDLFRILFNNLYFLNLFLLKYLF